MVRALLACPVSVAGFDVVAVGAQTSEGARSESAGNMVEVQSADIGERALNAAIVTAACSKQCRLAVRLSEVAVRAGAKPSRDDNLCWLQMRLRRLESFGRKVSWAVGFVKIAQDRAQMSANSLRHRSHAPLDKSGIGESLGGNGKEWVNAALEGIHGFRLQETRGNA